MDTYSLEQLIPRGVFAMFIVFARVGAAISVLPGFGEAYVPARVRLIVAIAVSALITPLLSVPTEPGPLYQLFLLLFGEIFIGLFLGLIARILLAALETGGAIIAMQASLSSALVFNPGASQPETLPTTLFTLLFVVLLFVTNGYALLLHAVVGSYVAFPIGVLPPFDDMSAAIVQMASRSFLISVELAAPFLVVGTLFYAVLGLASRIMPQLQVFFIALPMQLLGGLAMLALLVSATMLWFLGTFENALNGLARLP